MYFLLWVDYVEADEGGIEWLVKASSREGAIELAKENYLEMQRFAPSYWPKSVEETFRVPYFRQVTETVTRV